VTGTVIKATYGHGVFDDEDEYSKLASRVVQDSVAEAVPGFHFSDMLPCRKRRSLSFYKASMSNFKFVEIYSFSKEHSIMVPGRWVQTTSAGA
jgi:hypothetical protein